MASRNDDFTPPFTKKMKRDTAEPRSRTLTDEEIRALWQACEAERSAFASLGQLLLLTGQRLSIVAMMRWQDIDGDVWSIPQEARAKGNIGRVRLPEMAMVLIRRQPRIAGNPYVLAAGRGPGPIVNFTDTKRRLDRASSVRGWVLHDLRRTHRSLASRAGANRDHSERVLGHLPRGVEGTYDRFHYTEEKSIVLQKVADLIADIIGASPGGDKIVQIGRHRRSARR